MKKNILFAVTFFACCLFSNVLTSCSNDDNYIDEVVEEAMTEEDEQQVIKSSGRPFGLDYVDASGEYIDVTSEKDHQRGQKHRSSNNFNLSKIKKDNNKVHYILVEAPDGVKFNIMEDKTGKDPTRFTGLTNGSIVRNDGYNNVYISDPSGAKGKFDITFYDVTFKDGVVYVESEGTPKSGQKHRSSETFRLISGHTRYRVVCSNEKASFHLYQDITGIDKMIAKNVKHGDYINYSSSRTNFYIYDPAGTNKKSFAILFVPEVIEWMTPLDGNILITDLSIPGTHDTGTQNVTLGPARCQHFCYEDQLDFGIRYFDMRVRGDMEIVHGGTKGFVNFKDYLKATYNFLKAHRGETIIMQISDESSDMPENFKKLLDENPQYKDMFYFGTQIPRLKDVRGKVVCIRRFNKPDNGDWGIDVKSIWPHDRYLTGTNSDGVDFCIEDKYYTFGEFVVTLKEKKSLLKEAMYHSMSNPNCLTLGFSSIAYTIRLTATPEAWAWGVNTTGDNMSHAISQIVKEIRDNNQNRVGVGCVIMDFYSNKGHNDYYHNVENIINLNFQKSSPLIPTSKLHSDKD